MVDFEAMTQLRQDNHSRRRRVKRDLATIPKKGIAGLRLDKNNVVTDTTWSAESTATAATATTAIATTASEPATEAAVRIATHIIDSTLANSDDDTGDLLGEFRYLSLMQLAEDTSDSENEYIF